ncbi:hypothetical protein FJV05_10830, partial [Acinetobacter baumannii]
MNQNQQAGQPQATFIPSDFNDLHLMFGLEEVKAQIVQAINTSIPLSPEPPKTNKSIHIEGQIEKVSHVPVVEENLMAVESGQGGDISTENDAVPESIQKFIDRYYLIEAKTDVWDNFDKIV